MCSHEGNQEIQTFLDGQSVSVYRQRRIFRSFVRCAYPSEIRKFARTGECIMALGIAPFANLDRCLYINFVECIAGRCVCGFAIAPIGRYKGRDDHQSGICEECCDLADPTDIFRTILMRKAKIGIESASDIVAIKRIDLRTQFEKPLFQTERQRRFARTRQAGEPQDGASVPVAQMTLVGGNPMFDGDQIFGS